MDLFEDYQNQPPELASICGHYLPLLDDGTEDAYKVCARFLEEVEKVGHTFDYGLDGTPYDLRKK